MLRLHPTLLCSGLLLISAPLRAEDWQYQLSAGLANLPRYSGSGERITTPLLDARLEIPQGFFLGIKDGLGWQYAQDGFGFSLHLGSSDRRKDSRSHFHGSDRLEGMGSIKQRGQLSIAASYDIGPVTLGASLEHALKKDSDRDTGSAYNLLELSLGGTLAEGAYGRLDASLSSRFGDDDYLRTWYGVSRAQASRSRFAAHDTDAGLVSSGAALSWTYPLSANMDLVTALDVQRLMGDAADSPLTERRTQAALATQINYRF
ncbi:MipA/OmpV family protein [Pseudomonas sp. TUM22785]|uniref:MipA/OmpV family protein n=1 Tax=Pseudomonas sp. TUM22785 TaxID=3019098 RepID=UPI0023056171|nr:MipA/OmpV family protein [Pseudomonas sp. TUM22785]WCD78639.1 MipA/OmpV family protein [Pseudomonas sp. TUM22785]